MRIAILTTWPDGLDKAPSLKRFENGQDGVEAAKKLRIEDKVSYELIVFSSHEAQRHNVGGPKVNFKAANFSDGYRTPQVAAAIKKSADSAAKLGELRQAHAAALAGAKKARAAAHKAQQTHADFSARLVDAQANLTHRNTPENVANVKRIEKLVADAGSARSSADSAAKSAEDAVAGARKALDQAQSGAATPSAKESPK